MSPGVFFVCVVMSVVMKVHSLELKVGLCLFHGPTSVLSQCIIYLPSMWLPYIYPLALLSSLRNALFPNISPPKSSTTKVKLIGRFLCLHSPGVLLEGC